MIDGSSKIETGHTYVVTHPWKGEFVLRVRRTNADFTAGIVLAPDDALIRPGSEIIVLTNQCTFRPYDSCGSGRMAPGGEVLSQVSMPRGER